MIRYIKGDLVKLAYEKDYFDVIVHGCNCFNTMGAGIAKRIKQVFPEAYKADLKTKSGDKKKLGCCSKAQCRTKDGGFIMVVNAYTQYKYGGDKVNVNYNAVRETLMRIGSNFKSCRIGLPKIGCGLAGGDWRVVEMIIKDEMSQNDVTIVEYDHRS